MSLVKIQEPAQMLKFLEKPGQKPSRTQNPQATKNKLLSLSVPGTKQKALGQVVWIYFISGDIATSFLSIKLPERHI